MRKFIFLPIPLLIFSIAWTQTKERPMDSLVRPRIPRQAISVGDANADIPGFTSDALELAVSILKQHGGGTIELTKGTFAMQAPVRLGSNIILRGQGRETILRKVDGLTTSFIIDADYGELKATVKNSQGFEQGMAIQLYDAEQDGGWAVTTAIITEVVGNTLYFDTFLVRDYQADHTGTVSNACSIISALDAENVRISNITIDGNKASNDYLNGCRGGAVYLHKVKNAVVESLLVKDFNGDGISWQITEDVVVRNCEITGCTNSGLHPGTGSPRTLIMGNNSHHNDNDGLFVCWRVQHGAVRNNRFHHNGRYGVCTGHKDTDMVFENNHVFENGEVGIHFRNERAPNAPHRNLIQNNVIENNGSTSGGYGLSFDSPAEQVVLEKNIIRDTGMGKQKVGVFLYEKTLPPELRNNQMSGHTEGDVVYEKN